MHQPCLALVTLLFATFAKARTPCYVLHETQTSQQWEKAEWQPDNKGTEVTVRVALKQRNVKEAEELLLKVSDPASSEYGRYYTLDDVIDLFAPEQRCIDIVKEWLVGSGINASSILQPQSRSLLKFTATIGQLESMLRTTYHYYVDPSQDEVYLGVDSYSLPPKISALVDFITPAVFFTQVDVEDDMVEQPSRRRRSVSPRVTMYEHRPEESAFTVRQRSIEALNCSAITPACIKAMYSLPDNSAANLSMNKDPKLRLGIAQFSNDRFSHEDLDAFYEILAPYVPKGVGPSAVNIINSGSVPVPQSEAGIESSLNLEASIPLIHPIGTETFQMDDKIGRDFRDVFLDAVGGSCFPDEEENCGKIEPTAIISISWGYYEHGDPVRLLKRQCLEFLKLGLRGITVLAASGNNGVANQAGPCLGPKGDIFTVTNPGTCPYITSVGATSLSSGIPGDKETASMSFSSAGGFSNVFTTPSYQVASVSEYLTKSDPGYASYETRDGKIPTDGGIFNRAGRGIPDIAAVGDSVTVVFRGQQITGSAGTSYSSPVVASILTLINAERAKAGKPSIGFINPVLYQNPDMLNDITIGNQEKGRDRSNSTAPEACGSKVGFTASKGWDPVTGLGTPNYPEMLKVFMSI